MTGTPKAQMAIDPKTDRWRLFVVLEGLVSDWPEVRFAGTYGIPTLADRAAALAQLGYQVDDPDGWYWCEGQTEDHEPVQMLASVTVKTADQAGDR